MSTLVRLQAFDQESNRVEQPYLYGNKLQVKDDAVVAAIGNIQAGGDASSANQILINDSVSAVNTSVQAVETKLESLRPSEQIYGTNNNLAASASIADAAYSNVVDVSKFTNSNLFMIAESATGLKNITIQGSVNGTNYMDIHKAEVLGDEWYSMNINLSGLTHLRLQNNAGETLTISATVCSQELKAVST